MGAETDEWLMTYGKGKFEGEEQYSNLWKSGSKYTKQNGAWDDQTFYVRSVSDGI